MRSEFQFINYIKDRFDLEKVGDDCAVLSFGTENDMVITSDLLVEDIDFRLEWATPKLLGHKSLAVSLSDIAAMGAEANWALVSVGVPESLWKTDFLDEFYDGWHKLANEFGVELIGGDISRSPDKLFVDCSVIGNVATGRAIMRSGANPGDAIFVSGTLGGSATGLRLLKNGSRADKSTDAEKKLIERQLKPPPHLTLAKQLQALHLVTSMIDISDGLAADIFRIIEASGVGALIEHGSIPIDPGILGILDAVEASEMALFGGEDFELLFTVPAKKTSELREFSVTQVGEITSKVGELLISANEEVSKLEPKGFQHF